MRIMYVLYINTGVVQDMDILILCLPAHATVSLLVFRALKLKKMVIPELTFWENTCNNSYIKTGSILTVVIYT